MDLDAHSTSDSVSASISSTNAVPLLAAGWESRFFRPIGALGCLLRLQSPPPTDARYSPDRAAIVNGVDLDGDTVRTISEHLAQLHECVPLLIDENVMVLAISNPDDANAVAAVAKETGLTIEPVEAPSAEIRRAIAWAFKRVHALPTLDELLDRRHPFALANLDVEAAVLGPVVDVRLRQSFSNPFTEDVEAVYVFPLPGDATVHQFRLKVGERIIEGEVTARTQRDGEEAARARAFRTSLVEQRLDNLFALHVGVLPSATPIEVELHYAQPLDANELDMVFRFPLYRSSRYGEPMNDNAAAEGSAVTPLLAAGLRPGASLRLQVSIQKAALQIVDLACSQHIKLRSDDERTMVLTLDDREALAERDFILKWRMGDEVPRALLLCDDHHFMVGILPPLVDQTEAASGRFPRDVVFLIDRSASMGAGGLAAVGRAVAQFLKSLAPQDRFSLLAFDEQFDVFQNGALCDLAHGEEAERWLQGLTPGVGTKLLPALRSLLKQQRSYGRLTVLVLISDGHIGNEHEVLQLMNNEARDFRLSAFGIDAAANEPFLRRLAEIGRGLCEIVKPGDGHLEDALSRLAHQTMTPLVTDLMILDNGVGMDYTSMVPYRVADLYAARPIWMRGRKRGVGSIAVEGFIDQIHTWSAEVSPINGDNPALGITWARDRVQALEDQLQLDPAADKTVLEAEMTSLALEHRLLTAWTTFRLVDRSERASTAGEMLRGIVQPVGLPAGWSKEAATQALDLAAPSASESPLAAPAEPSASESPLAAPAEPSASESPLAAPPTVEIPTVSMPPAVETEALSAVSPTVEMPAASIPPPAVEADPAFVPTEATPETSVASPSSAGVMDENETESALSPMASPPSPPSFAPVAEPRPPVPVPLLADGWEAQFTRPRGAIGAVFHFQPPLPIPRSDEQVPTINGLEVDIDAILMIPEAVAHKHECVPLLIDGDVILVAISDTEDLAAIGDVTEHTGLEVELVVAPAAEIRAAIDWAFKGANEALPLHHALDCTATGFVPASIDAAATAIGPFADVRLRQTFTNSFAAEVEAVYVFPLPGDDTVVHEARVQVGGRILEAEVVARRPALSRGDASVKALRAAVERSPGNLFVLYLGRVPAGASIEVDLRYAQRLDKSGLDIVLRFPLRCYSPRGGATPIGAGLQAGTDLRLSVNVHTLGLHLSGAACSQSASVAADGGNADTFTLESVGTLRDRDFVLKWRLGDDVPRAVLVGDDQHFVLGVLPPPTKEFTERSATDARDVVFALDLSALGTQTPQVVQAVGRFMERLTSEDRFSVFTFGEQVEGFNQGALSGLERRGEAQAWLAAMQPAAQANFLPLLRAVMQQPRTPGRMLCVVLVSNGHFGHELEILTLMGNEARDIRLFAFAVDATANHSFLRRLSDVSRGSYELVAAVHLEAAMSRLAFETLTPLVTDLTVVDRGVTVDNNSLCPLRLPDLFVSRAVWVCGRKQGDGGIALQGLFAQAHSWSTDARFMRDDGPAIPVTWARDRIRALEDWLALSPSGDRTAMQREIASLAVSCRLPSDLTTFMLLDRGEVRGAGVDLADIAQPVGLSLAALSDEMTAPASPISSLVEAVPTVTEMAPVMLGATPTPEQAPTIPESVPVTELAPPVTELAAPVTELAPPVTELAPPVTELAPTVTELAAPVTELAAPVTELAPTVTEFAPPVIEFAPPVTEFAPSAEQAALVDSVEPVETAPPVQEIAPAVEVPAPAVDAPALEVVPPAMDAPPVIDGEPPIQPVMRIEEIPPTTIEIAPIAMEVVTSVEGVASAVWDDAVPVVEAMPPMMEVAASVAEVPAVEAAPAVAEVPVMEGPPPVVPFPVVEVVASAVEATAQAAVPMQETAFVPPHSVQPPAVEAEAPMRPPAADTEPPLQPDMGTWHLVTDQVLTDDVAIAQVVSEDPIDFLVRQILLDAVQARATHIHIDRDDDLVRVRFRVDGLLNDTISPPKPFVTPLMARFKRLANIPAEPSAQPQQGTLRFDLDGKKCDFDVHLTPSGRAAAGGDGVSGQSERMVLRFTDEGASFNRVGLPAEVSSPLTDLLSQRTEGFLIVTGPRHAGLASTLQWWLEMSAGPDLATVAISKTGLPPMRNVNQVRSGAELKASEAFRSALKEDTDVVAVDLLSDPKTARLALMACREGRRVLLSMHSLDATTALSQFVAWTEPHGCATYFRGVLAQRLVRGLCEQCKVPAPAPPDMGLPAGTMIFQARGCDDCGNIGYRGQLVLCDLMLADAALRADIRAGADEDRIRRRREPNGVSAMLSHGMKRVARGETSLEEVLRVVPT